MTEKKLSSASNSFVQQVGDITNLAPDKRIAPVWGILTEYSQDPEVTNRYEWVEVYPDIEGTWRAHRDDPNDKQGYGSQLNPDTLEIIEPAAEINGHDMELDVVVRLIPTQTYTDDKGVTQRAWLFANPVDSLRPFKLTADLIPTGGGELDETIAAEWLDSPGDEVELYPEHRSGWPSGDAFISLGVGRPAGAYFRGTYGWARWTAKATLVLGVTGPEWRGEWQIVTLYAETIHTAVIYSAKIEAGETGTARLWWHDTDLDEPELIDSLYEIDLYNDTDNTIGLGTKWKVYFNRNQYVWMVIAPHPPSGITIYKSATQLSTNAYVVLALDATMIQFGTGLIRNGAIVENDTDHTLLVQASWAVCAHRYLPGPPTAPMPVDCDAFLGVQLFETVGGASAAVIGTETMLSSSRRIVGAEGEGDRAVNTCAGSIFIEIASGDSIDLRIRHYDPADANDLYITLSDGCHFTVRTIQGLRRNDK